MLKISNEQKCFCWWRTKKEKIVKPIKAISDKKKKRIKEWWSEKDLFIQIAKERQVDWICICENKKCNKKIKVKDLWPVNFDHVIPKSKWEEYRLDKKNIAILCFACHFKKTNWQTLKVIYKN